jgi:thioesterase domain-containing protein
LLGRGPVGLDDDFFDLGGHSFLVAALQQRIAGEFKLQIPVAELLHWPTIREQAAVMQPGGKPALPPGVIALQPAGPRDTIFWMHSINRNLAEALGDDQPFLALVLTPEDVASLGNSPRLEDIADRHLRKILATQPEGPYTLGGFCAHGILAYEIASQLRTAGHEVALVILLDSYNPSWIRPRNSLSLKFNYLRYGISRLARIGRQSRLVHLRTRWHLLRKYVARTMSGRTALRSAYEMVEAAASRYRPETYDGKVLLVLASDRPPDVEPLPGWQAVVPSRLSWQYVDGHHSELLRAPSVGGVAAAISLHLDSHSSGTSHSYRTEATPPTIADRWDERDDALAFSER